MRNSTKRLLALLLVLTMALGVMPMAALADDPAGESPALITGTFRFAPNVGGTSDLTAPFAYSDSWFAAPSQTGNTHLATASMALGLASGNSMEGAASQNVKDLLGDMGFQDLGTNGYYDLEPWEQSVAVAVGHKAITVEGKNYTLLAVVPRSTGYRTEWAGNLTVGESGLHQGFQAARDEVLRYLANYVRENGIGGDLKIWVPGFSRGAAVANLVGAFLVDAGETYFGAFDLDVTLDPANVYVYGFGTPATVPATGVTLRAATAVSPARDGADDTEGGAFAGLEEDGTVDPADAKYDGIYNYFSDSDIVPMLPFAAWGFTRFGKNSGEELPYLNAMAEKADMLTWLQTISPALYGAFTAENSRIDPDNFHEKTVKGGDSGSFGLDSLVNTDNDSLTLADFYTERFGYIAANVIKDRTAYVTQPNNTASSRYDDASYQYMLQTLSGLFVGNKGQVNEEGKNTLEQFMGSMTKTYDLESIAIALYADVSTGIGHRAAVSELATVIGDGMDGLPENLQKQYREDMLDSAEAMEIFMSRLIAATEKGDRSTAMKTAATLLGNIYAFEGAHTGEIVYAWLSAADGFQVTANPAPGTYSESVSVTLQVPAGTEVYYTADGTEPTTSGTKYAGESLDFPLGEEPATYTVKAIAVHGEDVSPVATFEYFVAPAHVHVLKAVPEVPATCEETGTEAYWECEGCGLIFSDAEGVSEITTPVEIPALGHSWSEWTVTRESTETEEGEESRICARDPSHVETRAIPVYENPFVDVPSTAYYAKSVRWAVQNSITAGTDKTHFSPNNGCTRGQVVAFLWRTAGKPEPTTTECPFHDVAENAYYYKAVLWAVEKGITAGITPDTFSPNETCTRGQIVAFLYRFRGRPEVTDAENPFTDVSETSYVYKPVLWAVANGITAGKTRDTFAPGEVCTRAQVVSFLYREVKGRAS